MTATKDEAAILQMVETQHGIITSTQVTEAGIPRRCLSSLVCSGLLVRVERGVYTSPETALYLHAMTDRTPMRYTMTFPFGYNPHNVVKRGVIAKVTSEETYRLGIMTLYSPNGNTIKVYDIERTLCDMVRTRHKTDIQVVNHAMRMYAGSQQKHVALLLDYAQRLRVKSKILTYLEILL